MSSVMMSDYLCIICKMGMNDLFTYDKNDIAK